MSDQTGVSYGYSLGRAATNVAPDEVEDSGGFGIAACHMVAPAEV
jgi:hypothetical protein